MAPVPVSEQVSEPPWALRVPGPEDAESWLEVHHTSMAAAYPRMPAGFLAARRDARQTLLADLRETLGSPGRRRHLIAVDPAGLTVGIAQTHPGAQAWERGMLGGGYAEVADGAGLARGLVDPPLLQLTTLYTVPHTHGSGLGTALARELIGQRRCYLWIMVGNARAEAFYRRLGFVRGSVAVPSGASWYAWPMFQMARD